MFLGVLPSWIGDLITVIAVAMGLPGLILWILGRKDANRRLEVEEGSLKKSEFDSITEEYQQLYLNAKAEATAAQTAASEAKESAKQAKTSAREAMDLFDATSQKLRAIRSLFLRVVKRSGIQLTPEEQEEFERTKPLPRRAATAGR